MTKLGERGGAGDGERATCAWCGRPLAPGAPTGRPRTYCRRSCRQRAYEARRRRTEDEPLEAEVIALRAACAQRDDRLWLVARSLDDADLPSETRERLRGDLQLPPAGAG